ncbi:MAG: hypothetical protein KDC07_04355 [Chitinophagaceae bacterium]|nr:hypothetical protein [Chitinophagaceae bacterium]MCB9046232.1 hypothetical protein [Chitinophagales bacterium]
MRQSATIRTHISVRLILLFVFAAHLLYPLTYTWRVSLNKEKQAALILSVEDEEYVTLTLSNDTYTKSLRDDGKELRLNDRMYDIVSVELTGDKAICKVLADDHETDINKDLASDIKKDGAGKTAKRLVNWQPVLYIPTELTRLLFTNISNGPYRITGTSVLSVGHMQVIGRPPRNV